MGNIPTGLQTCVERGGVVAPPRSLHPTAAIRALSHALIEHGADLVRRHDDGGVDQLRSVPTIEDHGVPLLMMLDRATGATPGDRLHTTQLIETLSQLPAEQRTMAVLVEVASLSRERAARLLALDLEAAMPDLAAATERSTQDAARGFELSLAS